MLQSESGFSSSDRSTELVSGADDRDFGECWKQITRSIIHLLHTGSVTQWGIELLNSQSGFFFLIQGTRIAFISQSAAALLACAPGGLGAQPPSPVPTCPWGGRDGRQQVLLGETQQVTGNCHVAKGDAQQAAGPRHGMPSHRFRLGISIGVGPLCGQVLDFGGGGGGLLKHWRAFALHLLLQGYLGAGWTVAVQMAFGQTERKQHLHCIEFTSK